MKNMHECLSKTYTPVVNWFIDVHQLFWDKRRCTYLIDTNGSYVPKVANNCSTLNGRYGAIAASDLVLDQ
jgi:hypothetical protein